MNDVSAVLDALKKLKASLRGKFYESAEWRELEHTVIVLHNRVSVIFRSDRRRRARWMSLGFLAGALFAGLFVSLMKGCK